MTTPICEQCDDTGGHDEQPSCWACAMGAAADYDGLWTHSSNAKRAEIGTLEQYVDHMVRDYNRTDNRRYVDCECAITHCASPKLVRPRQ
jgi:hypothetical protein